MKIIVKVVYEMDVNGMVAGVMEKTQEIHFSRLYLLVTTHSHNGFAFKFEAWG